MEGFEWKRNVWNATEKKDLKAKRGKIMTTQGWKKEADALGGKEPICDRCKKQIQTNHNRVIELHSFKESHKKKVYHGDCAMLMYSEMNPRRDDKIRVDTAKKIFEELDALCSDTGIGFGLDLEDALSNNARDSEKFLERLHTLKRRWK